MRKVKFPRLVINPQTGRYVEDGELFGMFHCWGSAFEEFEAGPGNYTVAIVEMPDGKIETIVAHRITFVEPATCTSIS